MRKSRTILLALVALWMLVGCGGGNSIPLQPGVWQATISNTATGNWTSDVYELTVSGGGITGWRYACDANWINCAPKGKGLAVSGTLIGATGDFVFTYTGGATFRVTGTFNGATFTGTSTDSGGGRNGKVSMTWVRGQY